MNQDALYSDFIVIGAGVVGLAIAKALSDHARSCIVLEKNALFGEATSSRNSEVIHAGIYYPQGSLKAKLCVQGKQLLYQYCEQRKIPHQRCGKLIVATSSNEEDQLDAIQAKANHNQVHDLSFLNQNQVSALEPNVKASAALISPSTGIIDAHQLMLAMVGDIEDAGNAISYQSEVKHIEQTVTGWRLQVMNQGELLAVECKWLINAAGLEANQLASHYSDKPPALYYCRGLYFSYAGKAPFRHLIYPVPEKNTVGLGIHSTLDLAGQVKFGPDTEYIEEINYQFPVGEELNRIKQHWLTAIQRYFPEVDKRKLQPAYTGIRPKLTQANQTAKDFLIEGPKEHKLDGLIHLLGIESPGLTSALAIADAVYCKITDSE
ncbi:NAD(P)/FAD-dependent oxidoreductase [Litoribacillus peritrichatus]|uniref:NAD(P)/FAD-dependent oxidoreductase n=1 Tax=Litoribacillus peritrichatus TaxID=718191 RepID=A0ABP7MS70_9GAMM